MRGYSAPKSAHAAPFGTILLSGTHECRSKPDRSGHWMSCDGFCGGHPCSTAFTSPEQRLGNRTQAPPRQSLAGAAACTHRPEEDEPVEPVHRPVDWPLSRPVGSGHRGATVGARERPGGEATWIPRPTCPSGSASRCTAGCGASPRKGWRCGSTAPRAGSPRSSGASARSIRSRRSCRCRRHSGSRSRSSPDGPISPSRVAAASSGPRAFPSSAVS